MGKLSDIYSSYKKSLDVAQDDYEASIKENAGNTSEFYNKFFVDLTVNLGDRFKDPEFQNGVIEAIEHFFGKRCLNFVAVDGSCYKHNSSEFMSFYGGAYGAKGTLSLSRTPPEIEYKRWEIEKDVSMVAFVPIPYSRILEVESKSTDGDSIHAVNEFAVSESDKIELTSIHLPIMQLAEIFLAYNSATSSQIDNPDLILIDNSLSGVLGYNDFGPDSVHLIGHRLPDGNILSRADVAVAQAHPFKTELGIPSTKIFSLGFAIIRFFHDNPELVEIQRDCLVKELGIKDQRKLKSKLTRLEKDGVIKFDTERDMVKKIHDPYHSWERTKTLFQAICKGIFLDKRANSLQYETTSDDGSTTTRWMSPDDIRFLIGIGMRALIETCWERKILLTGVVKDSASQYLTKHYLGVCKHFGKYAELNRNTFGNLPPTDRMLCELLPYLDENLKSPWGTIEFDSTFMTLRVDNMDGKEIVGGTFGGITRPERLFLRSIAQFYTRRSTDNLLTGHAIFVDRLAFPEWDSDSDTLEVQDTRLGDMSVMLYPTNRSPNIGQIITYFLLNMVTRNHFAEVIGYPDPLHKADQGAKSMQNNVKKLLESSELKFRSRPLTNTLREIRESMRR